MRLLIIVIIGWLDIIKLVIIVVVIKVKITIEARRFKEE